MPRFYFHVEDGSSLDEDGEDLPDLAAAKHVAVKLAGQVISETAATFWDAGELGIRVTDQAGLTLFRLEFFGVESPALRR